MKFNLFILATYIATSQSVQINDVKLSQTPETGAAIPICNGANAGSCTTADDVVKNKLRRAGKRAAPGDPDFAKQDATDAALLPNVGHTCIGTDSMCR